MKRASFSCCNFLCVVLAAAYLKYRRCRLSCLPFVWDFFSLWHTHTHSRQSQKKGPFTSPTLKKNPLQLQLSRLLSLRPWWPTTTMTTTTMTTTTATTTTMTAERDGVHWLTSLALLSTLFRSVHRIAPVGTASKPSLPTAVFPASDRRHWDRLWGDGLAASVTSGQASQASLLKDKEWLRKHRDYIA